jgi:hypothetical protein
VLVHSPFLRSLARPLLPKGWTASSFKTTGEIDAQRVALRTLGTRLAVLSMFSFLCKSASVSTSYLARDQIANEPQLDSILFLLTTLAVQAVPSAVALLLLGRYHLSRSNHSSDALMQSLLTREGVSVVVPFESSAAVTGQGQQAMEFAATIARLQAEVRTQAERLSSLLEENSQQRAQIAKLQTSITSQAAAIAPY